tara:strand:+ start:143983 stop:145701 length:1719 start_codon:yes stop_codon:yes gene_type:complete
MSRLGKIRSAFAGAIAGAVVLGGASAALAESPMDLRVKTLPQRELSTLNMRSAAAQEASVAKKEAPARAASSKSKAPTSRLEYKAIPTEYRDIKERVVFKTNVGYGLDVSQLSGNVAQTGVAPGDVRDAQGNAYADSRNYLLGDAIIGTRGILMPSLNSYFLSRFQLDSGGGQFTAMNYVYDSGESQPLLIRAGYAELEGLGGEKGGVLDSIYLRAGRQYRYGANRFVANFDGITAAYDHRMAEVSAFFGQRVSLFFNDDPGLLAGAGVKLRGEEIFGYPADLNVDFMRYDGGGDDAAAPLFIEANSRARVAENTRLYFRGRFIDNGSGADNASGLGRLGGQVRQSFGDDLIVIADVQKNFARELAFDYVGSSPIDVVNVGEQLGLAIGTPQNSTLVGARANYQLTRNFEGYAFYRNRLVKNAEESDAFSRPFQEFGLAGSALIGSRLTTTGQYKFRVHDLDAAGNAEGSAFDDTTGTGTKQLHELSGEARYNFGKKKASAAFGGYVRVLDIESPYAVLDNDGRGGVRFDVGYWPTSLIRLRTTGEVAQPSQSISADIDAMVSLRVLMEASF